MRSQHARAVAGRRTSLAIALSVAVHLVVLISLSIGFDIARQLPAASPDIEVRLVRLARQYPPKPPSSHLSHANRARSPESSAAAGTPARAAQAPARAPPEGPSDPNPESAEVAAARNALRASMGCYGQDVVELTPEEREACRRRRLATLKQPVPTYDAIPSNPGEAAAILHDAHCNDVWKKYRDSYSLNDFPGGNCEDAATAHR